MSQVTQIDRNLLPKGHFQASVTTVVSLAAAIDTSIPAGARLVYICPDQGSSIRWRDDGISPTASVGMPLYGASAWPYNGDLTAIQLVSQSGTAVVNFAFFE